MNLKAKFLNCYEWNFDGKQGITVLCFDVNSKQIIKAKSDKFMNLNFADDVILNCVPNGRYVKYVVA